MMNFSNSVDDSDVTIFDDDEGGYRCKNSVNI